jgi:hypothetical protein
MFSAPKQHLAGRRRATGVYASAALRRTRGQAFSLVEVLIALVVLMVGIYAMLRIFPRGYRAVELTEQRTTAALLAEAELNRWRLQPDALPDAVVATDYQGVAIPALLTGSAETLTGAPSLYSRVLVYGERAARMPLTTDYSILTLSAADVALLDRTARPLIYNPGDLTPSQFDGALEPLPTGVNQTMRPARLHPCWEPNSLYLPRTIVGERIDIRRLGTTPSGVPFYLLSHAPLDVLRYEPDTSIPPSPNPIPRYVDIYDARPWTYGASVEGALREREFRYDPASGAMVFGPQPPPAWARSFKVDYTDPNSLLRVFGGYAVTAAGSDTGTLLSPIGLAVRLADPGSFQVHERMIPLTDAEHAAYVASPALWPRNAYYVNAETALTGKIEFSPLLQLLPQPGDVNLAKVDYRVRDWQVMVFDVEVPSNGVVQLPVRGLKGPTYTNPPRQDQPQEVARGIKLLWNLVENRWETPDYRNPATWAYVVAVDRQTGEILTDHEGITWPGIPQERLARFRVNYRDSLLAFNYGEWEPGVAGTFRRDLEGNAMIGSRYLHSRSGRTFRVFCRAQGDWAVQLSLASRLYARAGPEPGYLYGRPGGPAVAGVGQDTPMTYAWYPPENTEGKDPRQLYFPLSDLGQVVAVDYYYVDAAGATRYVTGEVHSIAGPNVTELGYWACHLSGGGLVHRPNAWGPVTVRGLSVRARVSWVGPGRSTTLQDVMQAYYKSYQENPNRQGPPIPPLPSLNESWHQITLTTYLTRVPL